MEFTLRGLFTPLITPFTDSGDLAADALEALAHSVIDAGAVGLVALGTTGEHDVLSDTEHRTVLDTCARVARARRVPLIAAVPGIAGIKHAVGGIDAATMTLMAGAPDGFSVLGGDDSFVSPLLALGAAGGILACSHLRTADFARLIDAWHAGDVTRARAITHALTPLAQALMAEPNPVVIKGVLHARGVIPSPAVRLPFLPAKPESVEAALALAG